MTAVTSRPEPEARQVNRRLVFGIGREMRGQIVARCSKSSVRGTLLKPCFLLKESVPVENVVVVGSHVSAITSRPESEARQIRWWFLLGFRVVFDEG